jgi:hypothetical protein
MHRGSVNHKSSRGDLALLPFFPSRSRVLSFGLNVGFILSHELLHHAILIFIYVWALSILSQISMHI